MKKNCSSTAWNVWKWWKSGSLIRKTFIYAAFFFFGFSTFFFVSNLSHLTTYSFVTICSDHQMACYLEWWIKCVHFDVLRVMLSITYLIASTLKKTANIITDPYSLFQLVKVWWPNTRCFVLNRFMLLNNCK